MESILPTFYAVHAGIAAHHTAAAAHHLINSIIQGTEITLSSFLICTAVSLLLGVLTALLCLCQEKSSRSFALTLAMLPAVVQVVIMLVNGNIGTGVAILEARKEKERSAK